MEKEEKISEGQAGFRPNRSCVDRVYTLGIVFQGRNDAGRTTYCFFLHVQKECGEMGCGSSCGKLGVEERMRKMMGCARSVVMLDGELSKYLDILQGDAQGCTISPNLFKVHIDEW